jgi:lipopolysaccharide biosynthesis glycosyltransferase
MLYFDLDVVIVRDLQWIFDLDPNYFYGIRDFRYLQRPGGVTLNSSCMWWDVSKYSYVWDEFIKQGPINVSKQFHGDQDFITATVNYNDRRYFEDRYFESYRWQCLDGGFDFQRRQHRSPGSGVRIAGDTAVVVFHGKPKPHEVRHAEITGQWV